MKKLLLGLFIMLVSLFSVTAINYTSNLEDVYVMNVGSNGGYQDSIMHLDASANYTYYDTNIDYTPQKGGLTIDANNNIIISQAEGTDLGRIRMLVTDSNGNITSTYIIKQFSGTNQRLYGLTLDFFGNIVTVLKNGTVFVYYNATNFTTYTSFSCDGCYQLAIDSHNNIWATQFFNVPYQVIKFDYNTNYATRTNYSALSVPSSIAIDKFDNVWVTAKNVNEISMFNVSDNYNRVDFNVSPLSLPNVITTDSEGNVIVTGDGSAVIRASFLNISANYKATYNFSNNTILASQLRGVCVDKDDNIFISASYPEHKEYKFSRWGDSIVYNFTKSYPSTYRPQTNIVYNPLALMTFSYIPLLQPPVITVNSPANQTVTNNNTLPITFTVTDADSANTSCELYVDSVLNASNSSVLNNTLTIFSINWDDGTHNFYIVCTDPDNNTDTTATYSILVDTIPPMIESESPSLFNTTTLTNYTMQIKGNTSNTQIINFTRILYYPNMSVFDYNETAPNSQSYSWDDTFNTTPADNGVWTLYMYSEDLAHNVKERYVSFTVDNCVPNYQCAGYATCNASDLAPCNETVDSNNCSYGSLPSPSTFPAQSCNYCSADVTIISTGDCDSTTDTQWVYEVDNNWDACCNVTQIVADCPTGLNTSSTNTTQSCSIFDYSENDMGLATISTIAKFFISGYGFVILFVAIGVFSFAYPTIKNWLKK